MTTRTLAGIVLTVLATVGLMIVRPDWTWAIVVASFCSAGACFTQGVRAELRPDSA